MAAALVLQPAVDVLAGDAEHEILEAAELRRARVEHLHLPALLGAEPSVHLVEVPREEGRLVAAGAGPDLHDAPRAVGILVVGAEVEQLVPRGLAPPLELGQLRLDQGPELPVVTAPYLGMLGDLPLERQEGAVFAGHLGERAVLAGHRSEPLGIGQDRRVDHVAFERLETGEPGFELVAHGRRSGAGVAAARQEEADSAGAAAFFDFFRLAYPAPANFDLNFSMRPAVSTNFSFPVKNGWQTLQMSTLISGTVLRVEKVLPQPQRTTVST